jgi:hypothetical protein
VQGCIDVHVPAGPTTTSQATTPRAALAVVFVALSMDLLVHGIAVPVLPRLAAVTDAGPSAAGLLFACYAAAPAPPAPQPTVAKTVPRRAARILAWLGDGSRMVIGRCSARGMCREGGAG